jgi:hypothetical protein
MKKKLNLILNKIWLVPVLIVSLNILIAILGFITQTPALGTLLGATAAFMIDPIIILFAVVLGVTVPKSNLYMWIAVFFGGPIILVLVLHFILNTPYLIFDFFRLNSVMIIVSIVYLIKYKFSK